MAIDVCEEAAQEKGLPPAGSPAMPSSAVGSDLASPAPMDAIALEALAFNQETSLRVYSDHHFFSWTQGMLQNLVRHEALVCVLRNGDSKRPLVESYTMAALDAEQLSQHFRQSPGFAEQLIKNWEKRYFQPVQCDLTADGDARTSAFVRELQGIGADCVVAHGTHDADGRMGSFFIFACRAGETGAEVARMVELLVPFVHAAWLRAKVTPCTQEGGENTHSPGRDLLTQREQEVLKWVCLGKSNIEIGMILGISALTVKNHVQEILRRLNVQNRAQAVGKAFNLHILSS